MPKITKRQREKLLTYLTLLSDTGKVEYLLECGYEFTFNAKYGDFCFVRIDSVNWKAHVKAYKAKRKSKTNAYGYTIHELYLKNISQDFISNTEVKVNWSNVANNNRVFDSSC